MGPADTRSQLQSWGVQSLMVSPLLPFYKATISPKGAMFVPHIAMALHARLSSDWRVCSCTCAHSCLLQHPHPTAQHLTSMLTFVPRMSIKPDNIHGPQQCDRPGSYGLDKVLMYISQGDNPKSLVCIFSSSVGASVATSAVQDKFFDDFYVQHAGTGSAGAELALKKMTCLTVLVLLHPSAWITSLQPS